jgi:hypothetical protein
MISSLVGIIASSGGPAVPDYKAIILADNPIGFWMLDETSGSTATDSSTQSRNATYLNSPTLNQSGPSAAIPKSVAFNAASSQGAYTASVSTYAIAPSANWSIEGWFKSNAADIEMAAMTIHQGYGASTSGNEQILTGNFFANVTGNIINGQSAGTASNYINLTSSGKRDNAWHYFALTSASGGNLTLYIDGTSVGSSSTSRRTSTQNNSVGLGMYWTASGSAQSFYTGNLAACAVYNTTLSSTKITDHYNAGKP